MRLRPVLALFALSALGCGLLDRIGGPKSTPKQIVVSTPSDQEQPKSAELPQPTTNASGATIGVGERRIEQSSRVNNPNVQHVDLAIPDDAVVSEVKYDYEYLHEVGKIDACPEGATLQEKATKDENWAFCGLSNGMRHGPWISWWTLSGQIKEIGPYVTGKRHGIFTSWDQKGKLTSRYEWDHGVPGNGRVFE